MNSRPLTAFLALLLLVGVSRCGGCEEELAVSTKPCPPDLPELAYSTSLCDQPSVVLRDWTCAMEPPAGDYPEAERFGERSRLVSLATPTTGEAYLNFYNGGGGDLTYQVLARRGGNLEVLQPATRETGLFALVPVRVPAGTDGLYVRLETAPAKRADVAAIEDAGSYVEITASEQELVRTVATDPEAIRAATAAGTPCAGNFTGRLIVSSCGRDVDLANWAAELGLEIRDVRRNADGSSVGVVILPNSAGNPTRATTAVKQKKVDVNGDSIVVEPDILFTVEVPQVSAPGAPNPNQGSTDAEQEYPTFTSCQPYRTDRPASSTTDAGVRVAIIDSGIDDVSPFGTPSYGTFTGAPVPPTWRTAPWVSTT